MTEHIAEAIKDMSDTSADRAIGYAEWNENEARSLRLYRADNPSMPELAEMHEETATTLRALLAERDRLRAALENLVIAIGMGWDLDGVLNVARAALKEDRND